MSEPSAGEAPLVELQRRLRSNSTRRGALDAVSVIASVGLTVVVAASLLPWQTAANAPRFSSPELPQSVIGLQQVPEVAVAALVGLLGLLAARSREQWAWAQWVAILAAVFCGVRGNSALGLNEAGLVADLGVYVTCAASTVALAVTVALVRATAVVRAGESHDENATSRAVDRLRRRT